jgi:hypothetical protein
MDDFLSFPFASRAMLEPLERRLLARVDAVVATAEVLTRTKVPASGRTHHLPQGVDYEHFVVARRSGSRAPGSASVAGSRSGSRCR